MSTSDREPPRLKVRLLLAAVAGAVSGAVRAAVDRLLQHFTDN